MGVLQKIGQELMVGNYNSDLNKRLNAFYLCKLLLYKYHKYLTF